MGYIIVKTLLLTVSVILIAIGSELNIISFLMAGLGIGAAMGMVTVLRAVIYPFNNWSICNLHGGSVLASYFGGALFTLITFGADEILQSGYTSYSDPGLIFFASLLISLYAMVLILLGLYERTFWRPHFVGLPRVPFSQNLTVILLILVAMVQAYLLISGRVSFQGFESLAGGETPIFEQLATSVSTPILGICGYVLGDRRKNIGMMLFWVCMLLIPLELVWTTAFGRRAIIYSVTAMIGAYFWARGDLTLNFRALLLICGSLAAVYLLANLFVAIRLGRDPMTARLSQTMFEQLGTASERIQMAESEVLRAHFKNLQTRFFVIGYLADLIGGTRPGSALLGMGLWTSIVLIIPRLLFPGKLQFLAEVGRGETLINPRFGLPVSDDASSALTLAYADFLWAGVIIYPVVILIMGVVMAKMVGFVRDRLLKVYIMTFCLILFLSTEEEMAFYFVGMRTLIIIMLIIGMGRVMLGPTRPDRQSVTRGYRGARR